MRDEAEGAFRRVLGPWSAYSLVAGSMIGTGIFYFVAPVAIQLTSASEIFAVWVLGTLIASTGALCLAELAATYPQSGGTYVFLREAFGPLVAFLYMWSKFLIMRVGSLSIATLAFASFSAELFGPASGDAVAATKSIALVALATVTLVNLFGVGSGAAVQNTLTAAKLISLLAVLAIGISFAAGLLPRWPVEFPHSAPLPARSGWPLLAALIPVMWTLGGWDESPFVAEEVRAPERNLPLSILAGLWSVGLLFVLVNASYLAILSPSELAVSGTHTATLAMHRALGPVAAQGLALALMISTLGAANGLTLTGARLGYAAGRDNALLTWLAHLSPRTGAPTRALLCQAGLASIAVLTMEDPFDLLLYTAVAYWLFGALTALAVIVLRRKHPDRRRPFRVWGYPLTPIVFTAAALMMASSVAVDSEGAATATLVILGLGVLAYQIENRFLPAAALVKHGPDE